MKGFSYIRTIVILCGLYFVTGKVGLMIAPVSTFATLVWPPAGIALATLLLFGYSLWPGITLGAFLVNLLIGAPIILAAEIAVGNTLEALLGCYLLQRFLGFQPSLERVKDALGLLLIASPASTLVGAAFGVASLWFNAVLPASTYSFTWASWWVGDMLGDLVVVPLLLTWATRHRRVRIRVGPWRRMEIAAVAAAVLILGTLVFGGIFRLEQKNLPLSYLVFLPLIWAALRFGPRGAATATYAMSTIAIWGTATGFGPFIGATPSESFMLLQIFMGVVVATTLILAAAVSERHLSERSARENAARLKTLQEISLAVTSTLDLGSVLQILLQKIEFLIPYGSISFIRLLDKETGTLKTVACSNITEAELKQSVLDGGIALRSIVAETKTPVIILDAASDERIPHLELFQKYKLVSYMGLPLIAKGETLGDISLFTRRERRFSGDETEAFTTLAEQAAIAIYNSELFDETKRQADELREANTERADFTAMIVHDLRAPLGAIMGSSEILQKESLGPVNAEQKSWLARIEMASKRLLELVNHFLDLSRLEAGRIDLVKRPVDLGHLIQNTLDFHQSIARSKDIALRLRVDIAFPIIKADPNRLEEVLENLLSNAIKFSRTGGAIELGVERENEEEIRVWIKDNGVGIPDEEIGELFKKYRQTASGKKSKHKGTGLGLVICKMIVEAHGGRIWVESEEGLGTTFYFCLPINEQEIQESTEFLSQQASGFH